MTTTTWREELSWAAGFFDGEGSTTVNKKGSIALTIGQVDNEAASLHRFHNAVLGLGKIYGPYQHHSELNAQPYYSYRITTGSKVQAAIAMLWPFIGDIKRKQAARVLRKAKWQGEGMCQNNKHLLEKVGVKPNGRCVECNNAAKKRWYYGRKVRDLALAGGI